MKTLSHFSTKIDTFFQFTAFYNVKIKIFKHTKGVPFDCCNFPYKSQKIEKKMHRFALKLNFRHFLNFGKNLIERCFVICKKCYWNAFEIKKTHFCIYFFSSNLDQILKGTFRSCRLKNDAIYKDIFMFHFFYHERL